KVGTRLQESGWGIGGPGLNNGLYPIPRIWGLAASGPPDVPSMSLSVRSSRAAFPVITETNICFKILPSLSRNASTSTHGRGDGVGAPTLTTFNRAVWPEANPTIPELKSVEGIAMGVVDCASARCREPNRATATAQTAIKLLNAESL